MENSNQNRWDKQKAGQFKYDEKMDKTVLTNTQLPVKQTMTANDGTTQATGGHLRHRSR